MPAATVVASDDSTRHRGDQHQVGGEGSDKGLAG
jgi:hypothetical protein